MKGKRLKAKNHTLQIGDATIYQGDVREVLSGMADGCVQCVITSPPYWGLRDYGVEGQLGLEKTPEEYVEKMVEIFREVKRVLRDDGTLWLNMGDSYCNAKGKAKNPGGRVGPNACFHSKHKEAGVVPLERPNIGDLNNPGWLGLKPKDLCGIPWRLALALQADGWYLRSASPWVKRSAMPESVTDRPSSAIEYIFLLTKKPKYYYDFEAVKKELQTDPEKLKARVEYAQKKKKVRGDSLTLDAWSKNTNTYNPSGRNRRNTDWWFESVGMLMYGKEIVGFDVNPQAFKEAHFATFPEKLIEPMVLASTSEKGCCPQCGAPGERMVEIKYKKHGTGTVGGRGRFDPEDVSTGFTGKPNMAKLSKTIGWRPGCEHNLEPIPCTVLDPFSGAGTVALVAYKHGRKAIGIELSRDYVDMSARRIEKALYHE